MVFGIRKARTSTSTTSKDHKRNARRRGVFGCIGRKNDAEPDRMDKGPERGVDDASLTDVADEQNQTGSSAGPPPTRSSNAPLAFEPTNLQSKITEASHESSTLQHDLSNLSRPFPNGRTAPPPARTSAFSGPPRFDWIDIEYAAATKIQAIQRRNRVMENLESMGLTTSAIRNAKRRRKFTSKKHKAKSYEEDSSTVFNCCAMGLAFGDDSDLYDDIAYKQHQKQAYEEKVKQRDEYEDQIRTKYMRERGMLDSLQMLEKVDAVEK